MDRTTEYAKLVANGKKIAGRLERISCERHLQDLKRKNFDYEEFYDWCKYMGQHNIVLVSEYWMPDDFECIWSKETLANFDSNRKVNDDKNKRVEKLFIYKGDK